MLRCYTHPVTSEVRARGLDSLWLKTACIAKIARVCEMYFEWGIEPTVVKRFRSFLWPGAVLRRLLQSALSKDRERGDGLGRISSTNNRAVDGQVETPSKALAGTLGKMALATHRDSDSEDDGDDVVGAIHSERRHASTDHILEYRLEIRPSEFVRQARAGIMGSRVEMEDSAPRGIEDENDDDDGDEDGERPKKEKKPPPDPESVLRVWMPAVMVEYVYPGLVAEWQEKKRGKEARRTKKGKAAETKTGTRAWDGEGTNPGTPEKSKARPETRREQDGDDQRPAVKKAPATSKARKAKSSKVRRAEAGESDEASTVVKKVLVSAEGKRPRTKKSSTSTTSISDSGSTRLDDADPFLVASAPAGPKVLVKAQPAVEDGTDGSSISRAVPTLRPFPMSIPTRTRKHSTVSMPSSSPSSPNGTRARLKKSPRKSPKHVSPGKRSPEASGARAPSPSPARPLFRAHMKPLHMTARPAGSATADEVIVISSDSDTPARHLKAKVRKTKAAVGAKHRVGIKTTLASNEMLPDSDVIDLT